MEVVKFIYDQNEADFLNIESKISNAEKRRLKAIRDAVKQLKLDLFQTND